MGRVDSRWGSFSAQSQAAMCPPTMGQENPSPVCAALPKWCVNIPKQQPCAAGCAEGNLLHSTQQGEDYVSCIRSGCNVTEISGGTATGWATCNYGWYCESHGVNKCGGCSVFRDQLRLYNRSAAGDTFQCTKMPQHYGGMVPVGLAGLYNRVDQPPQGTVQCGVNTAAPAGMYCSPCPIAHAATSTGMTMCTPCAAGTSRVPRYDITSNMATASWNCALNPAACQPINAEGSCTHCEEGFESNSGGLCISCPGAFHLSRTFMGTTQQSVAEGISPCVSCPAGEIRRYSTGQCVACGSHEHIVKVLPSAGTRLTYTESTRYGYIAHILEGVTSHGMFESLFCDFSTGECPQGTVLIPTYSQQRFCAACPPGLQGPSCGETCSWNQYNAQWGPGDHCQLCPAGTHAPTINHNRDTLQQLFAPLPIWAGARFCETAHHPSGSPTGMVVARDTAYSSGWQLGALLNAPGFQTLSDPQACVRACVETAMCLAVTWVASTNACRMSHEDTYTDLQSGSYTWIRAHAVSLDLEPPPASKSCLNVSYLTPQSVPPDIRQTVQHMLDNGTLLATNTTPFPPEDNWSLQLLWLSVAPQSPDLCVPCPPGEFGPPVSTGGCFKCPPFHYQPEPGQTACLDCPVNYYTSLLGSTSCMPCPPNTTTDGVPGVPCRYANQTIATPPAEGSGFCAPGTYLRGGVYNERGILVNLTCSACGPGRISTQYDVVTCSVCPAGKTPSPSRTSCVLCEGNTYGSGGLCRECAPNYIGTADKIECAACAAGTGRLEGATTCTNCSDPFYSIAGGGCVMCRRGSQSWSNHTGCEECAAGFGRRGTQVRCTPCATGMFANPSVPTNGCEFCPSNHISSRPGSAECTRCPRTRISNKVVGGTEGRPLRLHV